MQTAAREAQLRDWINTGPDGETPEHEGLVMWGVWFSVNSDTYEPPDAIFATEPEAIGYAAMMRRDEWHVAPCIVGVKTRDNFEVPAPVESP